MAAEFKAAHPDFAEVSVKFDDGDSSAAYFDVHYKKPNDATPHTDHWTYERQLDGKWKFASAKNLK